MPLPVGQIAAFLAIAVPSTLILTVIGIPFSHTWLWLYVLPPGVLAWLVTRPVLEGKRLPELVLSQLRYLSEPATWCRMAPLAEKDVIVIVARVWRSARLPASAPALAAAPEPAPRPRAAALSVPVRERGSAGPVVPAGGPAATDGPVPVKLRGQASPAARPAGRPGPASARPSPEPGRPVRERIGPAQPVPVRSVAAPTSTRAAWPAQEERLAGGPGPAPAVPAAAAPAPLPAQPGRPVVRMTGDVGPGDSLNVVERALRSSPGASGWREPVVVVPGGHRPGKPDFLQRDQARATLPLPGPARIVVLGCTAGAGQTITTLLLGQMLTSLRGEPVAVVDLSEGESSLTAQARSIPVLLPARRTGAGRPPGSAAGRGLQVVTAGSSDDDAGQVLNAVVARYPLTLADPGAASVPKAVRVADQLILVAPATAEAAGSLAMTMEWLEAHDHAGLAAAAIVVLNGVSPKTAPHADKAAAVASGRCRAIVRVPWDARLKTPAALGPATVQAVTALAGVVVAALADAGTVSTASGSVTT